MCTSDYEDTRIAPEINSRTLLILSAGTVRLLQRGRVGMGGARGGTPHRLKGAAEGLANRPKSLVKQHLRGLRA